MEIDPNAIDQLFGELIVKSALGDTLKKAIEEEVRKITTNYMGDSPLRRAVQTSIHNMALEVLATKEIQDQIREAVVAKITPEFIQQLANRVTVDRF